MAQQAKGEFDVRRTPAPDCDGGDGTVIGHNRFDKQFHGPLDATSVVQMLMVGTEVPGSAWAADLPVADYPVTGAWQHRGQVVHVFTHFRLELEIWSAQVPADGLDGGWWAPPRALKGEALPTLFRKVLAAAGLD